MPLRTRNPSPRNTDQARFSEPQTHSLPDGRQMVNTETLPLEDVRHYMTGEPVTAHSTASITELARLMVNSVVQRVIIVDDEHRPTGIVSNTDLVAALASAHKD